jgi:hypothetical protein
VREEARVGQRTTVDVAELAVKIMVEQLDLQRLQY